MTHKFFLSILAMGLVAGMFSLYGADQEPDHVEEFMRSKLVHTQKALEALTMEDYDAVAKHGQELSLLSQAASWQVLQTAQYHQYSGEFRSACKSMTEAAKNKDLDAAALGFAAITLKCVNCHKYVRRVRTAALESADSPRVSSLP